MSDTPKTDPTLATLKEIAALLYELVSYERARIAAAATTQIRPGGPGAMLLSLSGVEHITVETLNGPVVYDERGQLVSVNGQPVER